LQVTLAVVYFWCFCIFSVQRDVPLKDTRSLSSLETAAAELLSTGEDSSPESFTGNNSVLTWVYFGYLCLQYFDTVGLASGRASGL